MHFRKILGAVIILGSLSLIGLQATKNESTVTFFTPAEVFENSDKFQNRLFRVSGLVLEGSTHWDPQTQLLKFEMGDLKGHNFLVTYQGIPPDLFKEKQGVIVEGRLNSAVSSQGLTTRVNPDPAVNPQGDTATLSLKANLLMVKHSEVYNTESDHSQLREMKLSDSLFQNSR